jgi:hypothetical protein
MVEAMVKTFGDVLGLLLGEDCPTSELDMYDRYPDMVVR